MSKLDKKSICGRCVHYDFFNGMHCCGAFPSFPPYNGIPDKYLTGVAKHTQIVEKQDMNMVFQDRNPYPKL